LEIYRIVLAHDHALVRQGLRLILTGNGGIKIAGEASDGIELIHLLERIRPDMAILDISMPNLRGMEIIRDIKALHSKTKVLILTVHNQAPYVHQAMAEGADGYVVKEDSGAELISAIEVIRKGKVYISQRLRDKVGDPWQISLPDTGQPTTRERQVLKLIAEGKSNREIATLLYVSARTVESHRANIMRKLKLKRTADLVRFALHHGFG